MLCIADWMEKEHMTLLDRRFNRRRFLVAGTALATSAVLAACGQADDDPAGNGQGQGQPSATPPADPTATPDATNPVFATDGEAAVVSVSHEGGFLMVEDIVSRTPIVSLFNSGNLIVPGPVPEIFPQQAAPNLRVTKLSEAGVSAIGRRVLDTGLFENGDRNFDSSAAILADAATTVFTVRLAGQDPVRVSAYALEFDPGPGDDMPDDEVEARQALRDLLNYLTSAPTGFPTDHIAETETRYIPERLEIISYPFNEAPYDFDARPEPTPWPLGVGPTALGEPFNLPGHSVTHCAVLDGDNLDRMLTALDDATELERWEFDGDSYYLINRPLLPGEEGCQSAFPEPDPPPTGAEIEHPTGDDELVMRFEVVGGFVPVEHLITAMPEFSLYGDGTTITVGPQIAIYPPPALPALPLERLTPEGIQMVLAEADAAGLLQGEQEWFDLTQFVTDVATGVLTIRANAETHLILVYGPGLLDVGQIATAEEVEFRERFDAFTGKLLSLRSWLPEDVFLDVEEEYPADRLQVVSQLASARPNEDPGTSIGWPLDTPLSELGEPFEQLQAARCFVLEGQEFADVMSLLSGATTITRWTSDGEEYILHVRPLLVDEDGC